MKTILAIALLVGIAYGVWKYLEGVQERAGGPNKLKSSENTLQQIEKEAPQ